MSEAVHAKWSAASLIEFAGNFRRALLGSASSSLMCVAVSEPLQALLEVLGQPCELMQVSAPDYHHCFLMFLSGDVLDATADQFSGMPPVYFGAATALHKGAQPMGRANVWLDLMREFTRMNANGCPKEYGRLVGMVLRTMPAEFIEFKD